MNFHKINHHDIANGPGVRVSLFVSGCRQHCKGCFNEITWPFDSGQPFTFDTFTELSDALSKPYITGLSVLGGEPMEPENQVELFDIIKQLKAIHPTKTVWLYTGYLLDKDLVEGGRKYVDHVTNSLLSLIDVLVDGPFIESKKDITLRFRGSSNQRIIERPSELVCQTVID